jgi:hypothetical protein
MSRGSSNRGTGWPSANSPIENLDRAGRRRGIERRHGEDVMIQAARTRQPRKHAGETLRFSPE